MAGHQTLSNHSCNQKFLMTEQNCWWDYLLPEYFLCLISPSFIGLLYHMWNLVALSSLFLEFLSQCFLPVDAALSMEQDIPDYDMDAEDEDWMRKHSKNFEITELQFEEMMDRLEKGSGQQV